MVGGIQRNGLTLGKFPLLGDGHMSFIDGVQWLTADENPMAQSWATSVLIPYSRTAYRLTVDIPMGRLRKLKTAVAFVKDLPVEQQKIVTAWAGNQNWYIYQGKIPAKWIIKIEKTGA
jgi:hypothetical protein